MPENKKLTLEDILAEYSGSSETSKELSDNTVMQKKAEAKQPAPVPAKKEEAKQPAPAPAKKEEAKQPAPAPAKKEEAKQTAPVQNKEENPPAPSPIKEPKPPNDLPKKTSKGKPDGGKWTLDQYRFLFKQLVKRDFKGRYKRAFLGMLWSMLSPLLMFAAQAIVFKYFFGRDQAHFTSYLIIGNVVFHYFTDSVTAGMFSLSVNGGIISKIKVPKGIFILSKSVSSALNFGLTMTVMFIIVLIDSLTPSFMWLTLVYPIVTMSVFNIGVGMLLSVWFVFFKDTQYLFNLFTQVIMYFSAIFYTIDRFSETIQTLFYFNPIYCYITCFRSIVIDKCFPCTEIMVLCAVYAVLAIAVGFAMYKKKHRRIVYYF